MYLCRMLEKTKGIVLHTIKYSENSLVLVLYSEEFGRQSYMLSGIHSKKMNRSKKLIQPLSLLAFELYYKSSRELQKVKEYRLLNPLSGIHSSIIKTTIALFMAEILYRSLKEEEKNPNLFNFLMNSIEYLDLADKGVENFHLVFLIRFSKFLGFFPHDNYDSYNNSFSTLQGTFVPFIENEKDLALPWESELLHNLLALNYSDLQKLELNGIQRSRLVNIIVQFYQAHSEGIGQLKSHKILQEVFAGSSSNTDL